MRITREEILAKARSARTAGLFVQHRDYFNDTTKRGSAVGVMLDGAPPSDYDSRFNVTIRLAFAKDAIFNGLPADRAQDWPVAFFEAIPQGHNTYRAWDRIAYKALKELEPHAEGATLDLLNMVFEHLELEGTVSGGGTEKCVKKIERFAGSLKAGNAIIPICLSAANSSVGKGACQIAALDAAAMIRGMGEFFGNQAKQHMLEATQDVGAARLAEQEASEQFYCRIADTTLTLLPGTVEAFDPRFLPLHVLRSLRG
jgi:hypothetical protein